MSSDQNPRPDASTGAPSPSDPLTIRPHGPADGPAPAGLDGWLRNASLSTDGATLTVTDRTGAARRLPLAGAEGEGSYGVTMLVVVRETVLRHTRYYDTDPREREALCVIDSNGRRVVDIELYGWSRADLKALASAAGLERKRYAPIDHQLGGLTLTGRVFTIFDKTFPRARGYRMIRARDPWHGAAFSFIAVVPLIALYIGALVLLVGEELDVAEPWSTVLTAVLGVGGLGGLILLVRWASRRSDRDRKLMRTGPHEDL